MNKAELLTKAQELARSAETWADFSNALFDPFGGLLTRAFPSKADRQAFAQTEEYRKIQDLLSEVMDRTGFVPGATPKKKSGRFVVRLPSSLHAALEREAKAEGVSLNQLVLAKLAVSLGELVKK